MPVMNPGGPLQAAGPAAASSVVVPQGLPLTQFSLLALDGLHQAMELQGRLQYLFLSASQNFSGSVCVLQVSIHLLPLSCPASFYLPRPPRSLIMVHNARPCPRACACFERSWNIALALPPCWEHAR